MKKLSNFFTKIWAKVRATNKAIKQPLCISIKEAKLRAFSDMMEEGIDPYILNKQKALKELAWDLY